MYVPEKDENEGAMVDAGVSVQKEWQNGSVRVQKQKASVLEPIPEAGYQKTLKGTSGSKKLDIYGNTMKSTGKSAGASPAKSKRSSVKNDPNTNFTNVVEMKSLDDEKQGELAPPKLNNYSYNEKSDKMLSDTLGTELIIEKCIRALQNQEGKGAQTWPADAVLNKNLVKSLSHSKMKNEIDHQAPRTLDEAGVIVPISLCESVGSHSGFKQMRESKIAE